MRSHPAILQQLALNVWRTGASMTATARICSLPVGTVKTWRSRGKWERVSGFKFQVSSFKHETPCCAGESGNHATTHRGLSWQHMPGRTGSKKLTFAAFKRGLWPPREWRVPKELTGGELLMFLQERACMGQERKGGR